MNMGGAVLIYLAALQNIPGELYEAAELDGAGLWRRIRHVTIPQTRLILSLMAMLQIVAIYLLGRTIAGGLAGGMAGLFLLATFVWRRTPDGRGTALAFMLVAIGVALVVGRRRSGVKTALGAVALGVAVAVNPLIGACGMQVAAVGVVVAWVDLALPLVAPTIALAGASVLALPQVAIGLGARVSPYVLMLALPLAAALLWIAARLDDATLRKRAAARAWPFARVATIGSLLAYSLYAHAHRFTSFYGDDWYGYGLLLLLGAFGLVVAAVRVWRRPERLAPLGELRLITITTMKSFERYVIHALEGVYPFLESGGWISASRLKVRLSARACFSVSARASRQPLSRPPATNRL